MSCENLIANLGTIAALWRAHDEGYGRGYQAGLIGYITPHPPGIIRNKLDAVMHPPLIVESAAPVDSASSGHDTRVSRRITCFSSSCGDVATASRSSTVSGFATAGENRGDPNDF